jgi:DHA2 family multidrug resistance protein
MEPTTYPPPLTRGLISLFALSAAFMTQLDATIANVALPHMQASVLASREQITWVLTSYIIMAAIFTPLSGWLADRFGRKRILVISVLGFTGASALCGLAVNLDQLIAFRMLQGALGAALLPMSQAIMIDINPPERHGSAMAVWGFGAIIGPIIGPLLGGWLTENLTWRWVFFVNVPFGIIAALGLVLSMTESRRDGQSRFDLFGFSMLALAIGAFQLMLDRGQMQDWFQSREIWIEATVAAVALYVFLVHSFTARRPFVNLSLFRDSNFVFGSVLGFFLGGLMYGVLALLAPMLADLMQYPIEFVGVVTAPRGLGTMLTILIVGRLIGRVDARLLIFVGLVLCGWSTLIMARFSLEMDSWPVIVSGFIQGMGAGIMFVPITTIIFATLNPRYRNEGAAMNSLIRNMGASVWISVLQTLTIRNEAAVHSRLVEGVRPDNPAVGLHLPDFDFGAVDAIARMNAEISRQALMVSYADSFWFLFLASFVVAPVVLLLRPMRQ